MVNTALVTGHTEWDNLLLSFRAMVHTHTHEHTHTDLLLCRSGHGGLPGPNFRSGPLTGRPRAGKPGVSEGTAWLGESAGRGLERRAGSPFHPEHWSTLGALGHCLYWLLRENKRRCDLHKNRTDACVCVCMWL